MASWSSNTPIEDEPDESPEPGPHGPLDEEFHLFAIPLRVWGVAVLFVAFGVLLMAFGYSL